MKAFLAKDCYGVSAFIDMPTLIECRDSENKLNVCWSGKVHDFTTEIQQEIARIGADLVENKEVKEVDITINITIL